jgi:hypothetical protein
VDRVSVVRMESFEEVYGRDEDIVSIVVVDGCECNESRGGKSRSIANKVSISGRQSNMCGGIASCRFYSELVVQLVSLNTKLHAFY